MVEKFFSIFLPPHSFFQWPVTPSTKEKGAKLSVRKFFLLKRRIFFVLTSTSEDLHKRSYSRLTATKQLLGGQSSTIYGKSKGLAARSSETKLCAYLRRILQFNPEPSTTFPWGEILKFTIQYKYSISKKSTKIENSIFVVFVITQLAT